MVDRRSASDIATVRTSAANVLKAVCTIIAVMTALAAVAVAARGNINADNVLVELVKGVAGTFDGPFSRNNGVFNFSGDSAVTRNALVNWGIAAAAWLAIGRISSAVVRP